MEKKIILIVLIVCSIGAYSQVGINTPDPKATLDVVGKPTQPSVLDGIIAPRITGAQLKTKTYTSAQKGAFVFVTDADTAPERQTVNVTSSGYFFFDGIVWIKLNTGDVDTTNDAFINNPSNARVELGTNADGTTARTSGTDFVIQDNGHVGIGTSTPVTAMQVTENGSAGSNEVRMSSINNPPKITVDRSKVSANLSNGDELGRFVFNGKISGGSFPLAGIQAFYNGSGLTNSSSMIFLTSDRQKMAIDDSGNVSIGPNYPNASAALDLQATNKGLLLSRVSLNSLNDGSTISAPAKGLLVYNTNTNTTQVPSGEGIYYNSGTSSSPVWGKLDTSSNNFGDIKTGVQTSDHNGWIKLDGRPTGSLNAAQRQRASSLGFSSYLPNASNSYLVQNGNTLGSVSGANSKTIAQNQLPNTSLNGTTSAVTPNIHYDIINNGGRPASDTNSNTFLAGWIGTGTRQTNVVNSNVLGQASHSHSFTTSSINGGVAQQGFDITPRSLSVNVFMYLGN